MKLNLLFFGITRDIFGKGGLEYEAPESVVSVGDLMAELKKKHPRLEKLGSLALAVNNEYVKDEHLLNPGDEVALIPPVSGG